jgi:glycerol kinase
MAVPVVLAVDQGTTSVRATVLDQRLSPLSTASEALERSFPRPGWVDLDVERVLSATLRVAAMALASARQRSEVVVAGFGLANQGETVLLWDRATGAPLAPAVVWQCRRTEEECARLRQDVPTEAWVRELTGLPIDAYFSATKLAWLLDHVPGARERAARGEICGGTLDTFTLFRLSSGRLFVTDPSTACRTQLAELGQGRFSARLCELFRVPRQVLPEVVASDADLGDVQLGDTSVPVRALLCDQPSALLGTGCLDAGDVKCTYGTGAFLQVHAGDGAQGVSGASGAHDGLLRSIAWEIAGARAYLLEGSVLAAGDVLTWLRDGLGMIARPEDVDDVLARTPDSGGVLFVPALTGLGAPRWVGDARGTILGLSRGARREHVIRAALEGIAHQVADVLEVAARVRGGAIAPMWADGGLSGSDAFLQLQADLTGHTLQRAAHGEATTRGVAAVAAVRAGLCASIADAVKMTPARVVRPTLDEAARGAARARHKKLLDVATSSGVLDLLREG